MSTQTGTQQTKPFRSAVVTITNLLFGPLVWAAHLTIIYGVQSIVCARWEASPSTSSLGLDVVQTTILATTALSVAAISTRCWRAPVIFSGEDELGGFLVYVMRALIALSAFGVVAAGASALVLPACEALR